MEHILFILLINEHDFLKKLFTFRLLDIICLKLIHVVFFFNLCCSPCCVWISVPGNGFGQHDSECQVILRTFWAENEISQIDQILPQTNKKHHGPILIWSWSVTFDLLLIRSFMVHCDLMEECFIFIKCRI